MASGRSISHSWEQPLIKTHLWTFLDGGSSLTDGNELSKWNDKMLLLFPTAWANRVRVFGDDPTRNVSVCLRDRLDLAAAAALAYKHLSGSTVSEQNAMIEPLMRYERRGQKS
jgi:hypothetical protein